MGPRGSGRLRREGLAAVEEFDEKIAAYIESMIAMRRAHTEYANGHTGDKDAYREARTKARLLMDECYDASVKVIRYLGHPVAARFIITNGVNGGM